jgi:hypothetical protein
LFTGPDRSINSDGRYIARGLATVDLNIVEIGSDSLAASIARVNDGVTTAVNRKYQRLPLAWSGCRSSAAAQVQNKSEQS